MFLLVIIGVVMVLFGGFWLIVVTFRESFLWGISSLLLPIVGWVFVVLHWDDAKEPFLWQVAGIALVVIAAMIGARGLGGEVWKAIQRLQPGRGFEAGLGIVIVAIILDRVMQQFGDQKQ